MAQRPVGRRRFLQFLSALPAGGTLFGNAVLMFTQDEKKVTKEMLIHAEGLAGVRFTDAQRELMIPALESYLRSFERIREMPVPPEVPPATYFISDTRGVWQLKRSK